MYEDGNRNSSSAPWKMDDSSNVVGRPDHKVAREKNESEGRQQRGEKEGRKTDRIQELQIRYDDPCVIQTFLFLPVIPRQYHHPPIWKQNPDHGTHRDSSAPRTTWIPTDFSVLSPWVRVELTGCINPNPTRREPLDKYHWHLWRL